MSILPHRPPRVVEPEPEPFVEDARELVCRAPCESCGAAIPLVEGGLVICDYCREERVVGAADGVSLLVPFACSPDQALVEIKRWMRQEGHRATHIARPVPLLVPYWRVERKLLAWQSRNADPDSRSFESTVHRFEHVEPAFGPCTAIGTGLPFDDPELVVFPLDRSLVADGVSFVAVTTEPSLGGDADDRSSGSGTYRRWTAEELADIAPVLDMFAGTGPIVGEDHVRSAELERSVTLLYVPFYAVRFTFQSSHHSVLACGRTGRVTGLVEGEFRQLHPMAEREIVFQAAGLPSMSVLTCPSCSGTLSVDGTLLACTACGGVFRNDDGTLTAIACETAEGEVEGDGEGEGEREREGELLPFWRFAQTYRPGGYREPSLHVDLADRREVVTRFVYVPAFAPCPPTLARRLSVVMTENQPPYVCVPGAPEPGRRRPCASSVGPARAVAALVVEEIESYDGDQPSSGGRASFASTEPTLVWVPFTASQGFLTEPESGVHLSEAVLSPETRHR